MHWSPYCCNDYLSYYSASLAHSRDSIQSVYLLHMHFDWKATKRVSISQRPLFSEMSENLSNSVTEIAPSWLSLSSKGQVQTVASRGRAEHLRENSAALGQDPGSSSRNIHKNIFEPFCRTKTPNKWKMLTTWWSMFHSRKEDHQNQSWGN